MHSAAESTQCMPHRLRAGLRGGVFDKMGEVDVGATIGGVGDDAHHSEWQIGSTADLGNGG